MRSLAARTLACATLSLACCCCSPKIKGGPPVNARPPLRVVSTPTASFRVWVIVRSVRVDAYPFPKLSRQPLVQFTGDAARLKRGWGRMARLVSPTRIKAGTVADVFADKVLWTQSLQRDDRREFEFWLRQNQRSAPTPGERKLRPWLDVAQAVEGVSGALGTKIPAHQAMMISVSVLKALATDPLIIEWRCPWQHVLDRAKVELAKAKAKATKADSGAENGVVELDTDIVARERKNGKPTARATIRFIVQRLASSADAQ